jgi:hypothetical protein
MLVRTVQLEYALEAPHCSAEVAEKIKVKAHGGLRKA